MLRMSWLCAACLVAAAASAAEPKIDGRELFTREWLPHDQRSSAGDGLGPVFNDTSCVACHNQGGVGGAGPRAKNAQFASIFKNPSGDAPTPGLIGLIITSFTGRSAAAEPVPAPSPEQQKQAERAALAKIHPGFLTARSVVVHRFSTERDYPQVRRKLLGISDTIFFGPFGDADTDDNVPFRDTLTEEQQRARDAAASESEFVAQFGGGVERGFSVVSSERNTLPLFGSGLINAISEKALLEAAAAKHPEDPAISGRVAKLKDGRIGRFGWKAQQARLEDFVLTACAVELGLQVPGKPQLNSPTQPDYAPPGLDLTQAQCDALTRFVAKLPRPQQRSPSGAQEREYLEAGEKLFASTGCAACHRPQIGEVVGLYSDLLLHDMGQALADGASYSGFVPNSTEEQELDQPIPELASHQADKPIDESKLIGALRHEWRTPPLWGLRDSAPYLHDGRAATIEQAIALHGGEATNASRKFFTLTSEEQLKLTLFLKSLQAPP